MSRTHYQPLTDREDDLTAPPAPEIEMVEMDHHLPSADSPAPDEAPDDAPADAPEPDGDDASDSDDGQEVSLDEYCESVVSVVVPVVITLFLTVVLVKTLQSGESVYASAVDYALSAGVDLGATGLPSWLIPVLVAVFFVVAIVVVTFGFVLLFYFRCMKVIVGWLLLSVLMLLLVFGGTLAHNVLDALNVQVDWVTFGLLLANFTVLGVVSIFLIAPMRLNQFYMIAVSVLMASYFSYLPEWTTWALLIAMAVYDLAAVLCPKGPLNILVRLAQDRNEPIPALVYSTAVWLGMADADAPPADEVLRHGTNPFVLSKRHGRGIKLGLGDFVFYSVLVGRCALYDLTVAFTCSVAVISVRPAP